MNGRPYVVVHVAVSVDGSTTGFPPDVGLFYALASTWAEQATLVGADTILAQEASLGPGDGPAADGPLLAVVDGRRRVTKWAELRDAGHWSSVLGFHATALPPGVGAGTPHEELVLGDERVDLAAALAALAGRGADVVRVDSGGGLIAALLAGGLVDEVSLLVHPLLAGPARRAWYGGEPPARRLALVAAEPVGDGCLWMRYRLVD
jgi:2,5-diamino-6-(ribosylamino)-4(3H)-pyrimidinone 5'-phosphate reductase